MLCSDITQIKIHVILHFNLIDYHKLTCTVKRVWMFNLSKCSTFMLTGGDALMANPQHTSNTTTACTWNRKLRMNMAVSVVGLFVCAGVWYVWGFFIVPGCV